MFSSFRFGMGLEGEICWGPFPWWLVFHNWRQSSINAIICGGLVVGLPQLETKLH